MVGGIPHNDQWDTARRAHPAAVLTRSADERALAAVCVRSGWCLRSTVERNGSSAVFIDAGATFVFRGATVADAVGLALAWATKHEEDDA